MKLVTVIQAAEMDRTAIEDYTVPEIILMENAANAACRIVREKYGIEGNNFLILCGSGNNGGDGLALARLLYSEGGAPLILMNGQPDKLRGSTLENFRILQNYPIEIIHRFSKERLVKELEDTDIIIDALLGTGLSREITGELKIFIETVNSVDKPVLSIDIPTGINGDTGQIMGTAVRAGKTISFGSLKPGNILYPGFSYNGDLHLSRISFPPEIYDSNTFSIEINRCQPLPPRDPAGHKKSFGNILTISGARSYYGAPLLAASAVLKSGGGFSRLAAPKSMIPVLASKIPEVVFIPMEETDQQSIALSNLPLLLKEAKETDAVIIGPGLSLNSATSKLIQDFISTYRGFLIVDGDALSAVAGKSDLFASRSIPAILTPHMGEMSRLCRYSVEEIQKDPIRVLKECSNEYKAIVVLKGAHSLIGLPDGTVFINTSGNSGLGTAGSGDILTGIIGAFYGLGLSGAEAVKSAVFIHGAAGDLAAEKLGKDGLTASDILKALTLTVKEFRENYESLIEKYDKIIHEV